MYRKISHVMRRRVFALVLCLFLVVGVYSFYHLRVPVQEISLDPYLEKALFEGAVVRSEQIKIPGFPKAFNPSLIACEGGYLLSFRVKEKRIFRLKRYLSPKSFDIRSRKDGSFIGVVRLDQAFHVIPGTAELLDIISYAPLFSSTAEDARLFPWKEGIGMIFNDLNPSHLGGFSLYLGELTQKQGHFQLKGPAQLLTYAKANPVEKNWTPFVSEGKLYLIYSDQPRVILSVDEKTGECQEVCRSEAPWHWNWGEIRGGSPASLVDGEWLTFFHSSFRSDPSGRPGGKEAPRNYVMGVYTFAPHPPFQITSWVEAPLGRRGDYLEGNSRKVVFPGGFVVDKGLIHVVWGKDDHQMMLSTFDQKELFNSQKR